MPYAFLPSFLQYCLVLLNLSSAHLVVLLEGALLVLFFSLKELCLSEDLGLYSLFYPVHVCIALWDSLSGPVHSGIACLAFQAPDWAVAFWDACLACDWLPYDRCPSKHVCCKTDYDWLPL